MAERAFWMFLLVVTVFGLMSSAARAGSDTFTDWFFIEQHVNVAGNVGTLIQPPGQVINPAGCPGGTFYVVLDDSANRRMMQAALLGATLAKRDVNLLISGTKCSPGGRPAIEQVLTR